MASKTSNFGLIKPELMDTADITAFNENWDKIDDQLLKAGESGGSDLIQTELGLDLGLSDGSEIEGEEPTIDPTTEIAITKIVNQTIMEMKGLTQEDVVDNLESTNAKLPLSANQGNMLAEMIANLSNKVVEISVILDNTTTSDEGTVSKRVSEKSTTSVLVTFEKPFREIPTVTIALTKCENYKGDSMSGYVTVSTSSITKTSFVINFTNKHQSDNYYADCTVSWNASC